MAASSDSTPHIPPFSVAVTGDDPDAVHGLHPLVARAPGDEPTFEPAPLPLDADGFVQSYAVDDREGIVSCFLRHGVVVVRDVITPAQAAASEAEVWKFLAHSFCPTIRRDDPGTWEEWTSMSKIGILGSTRWLYRTACENREAPAIYDAFRALYGCDELFVNIARAGVMRPTRNVFFPNKGGATATAAAAGGAAAATDAPITTAAAAATPAPPPPPAADADSVSAVADVPTAAAAAPGAPTGAPSVASATAGADGGGGGGGGGAGGGVYRDMPHWSTVSEWLHLDMNPLTGRASSYGFEPAVEDHFTPSPEAHPRSLPRNNALRMLKTQAILALDDCRLEDGGFHCVPGFHRYIRTWTAANAGVCARANASIDPTTVQIPVDDPCRVHIQRLPIRRGCLLIWDSRLPHGNYPNASAHPRVVQYLHMTQWNDAGVRPFPLAMSDLPASYKPSPLGERLLGMAPWPGHAGAAARLAEPRNAGFAALVAHEAEKRAAYAHAYLQWCTDHGVVPDRIEDIPGAVMPVPGGEEERERVPAASAAASSGTTATATATRGGSGRGSGCVVS